MKELIEEAIRYAIVAVIIYAAISLCVAFTGLMDAQIYRSGKWNGKIPCLEHPTNLETLFPSYKLGCWIGAKHGEKYYWSKP